MRRLLFVALCFAAAAASAQPSALVSRAASVLAPTTFAALGTPSNSSVRYCSDCNSAAFPCTGGGSGAFAFRIGGAWACPSLAAAAVPATRTISTTSPLGGGGDLSADRTFTCATCATSANNLSFFSSTTSAQVKTLVSDETGSGGALVFATAPAVTGITTDTLQTSGNIGLGTTPSATANLFLDALAAANSEGIMQVRSTDAAGTSAFADLRATASTASTKVLAHGDGRTTTRWGAALGGWGEVIISAGNGLAVGTITSTPLKLGTNATTAITVDTSQNVTLVGSLTPSQTAGIIGTTTNNSANAGSVGEFITGTVAANTTSLSTGTTINVGTNTNITLTAGDWDCAGVVNFTYGATTSITNLAGGISTTTGTLPAQDSFFDFEIAANVPTATAVAAWPVPTVRLSVASSTNVFLVTQATFTLSTIKVGGTIRCRRMR